ncbi:MAG: MotA/TolQ/ExbB proton channel family protein [Nevskiales bacterium]
MTSASAVSPETVYNSIVAFFQGGGWHMLPIALTFGVGVAIALERFLYLRETRRQNQTIWEKLHPMLAQGQYKQARVVAAASNTVIGRLLNKGLSQVQSGQRREQVEAAIEEVLMEDLPRIERLTHYLHMLANVAMLFGLLGTIWGLIQGFTAIATVDPAQKASMLSASFSVAMNATAFGLITAIPLLLIHSVLQTRTSEIVDSLEMAAVKFMNLINQAPPPAATGPATS